MHLNHCPSISKQRRDVIPGEMWVSEGYLFLCLHDSHTHTQTPVQPEMSLPLLFAQRIAKAHIHKVNIRLFFFFAFFPLLSLTGYIKLAGYLCVLTLVFDLLATVMTGFGLCSKEPGRKYTLYRCALYVMVGALISILTALVVYPAMFAAEIDQSNRQIWEFGWAYGVGWGAAIFLFGAILLLLCDKETEEIYYKERTIIHSAPGLELKA